LYPDENIINGKRISKNRDFGNKSNESWPSMSDLFNFVIIAPKIKPIIIIIPVS